VSTHDRRGPPRMAPNLAPKGGSADARSLSEHCEVGAMLARRLGLDLEVVMALQRSTSVGTVVDIRNGLKGDEIPLEPASESWLATWTYSPGEIETAWGMSPRATMSDSTAPDITARRPGSKPRRRRWCLLRQT
jgi:hypothetical protein